MSAAVGARGSGPAHAFLVGPGVLAPGADRGRLVGWTVAVKDLIDVAGCPTTAGNPAWPGGHRPAERSAPAVQRLVDSGATVVGKVVTDELAWSLAGTNPHHGTPDNPAAPGRVPGGSSSGPAAAVAVGAARLGLGTDTGGSIRVPASYCELVGVRPSHGRVPTAGVVPLAPSLDTVGWLTATPADALAAGGVLLDDPGPPRRPDRVVLATDALDVADAEVAATVRRTAEEIASLLGIEVHEGPLAPPGTSLDDAAAAYRAVQGTEALATHGSWVDQAQPPLGRGVAARFDQARQITDEDRAAAEATRSALRTHLHELVGSNGVVALPAAPSAPPTAADLAEDPRHLRHRLLALGAPGSLAGAACLVLPCPRVGGLPVGCSLQARDGADEVLLGVLEALAATSTTS